MKIFHILISKLIRQDWHIKTRRSMFDVKDTDHLIILKTTSPFVFHRPYRVFSAA